ncbi:type II toxin-antitoxin system VapB family antitoxin [Aquidulcibacter sp.]|uniref:type II toxin-antitoxin system VapB family antitoxin n=1 Tax=Aquidulcibacter sp. TaxID=2052990 RepID=UPI0025B81C4A|nr:type II toxin-antitoxin system VapB family antitoxin [Aquidulcibacter sp.]MCA3697208.1 type II toxin-antitoxin system VapB family antitoxin [Aquidulcibacter sp.]
MPTEVNIDESLLAAAMATGGFSTRQEAVETALRELLERRRRVHGLRALRGKIEWIEGLDAMRLDRPNRL